MRKTILMLVVCCIWEACNQTPEAIAFNEFKKQIPYLKLPYKCTCYDTVNELKVNIPYAAFKKYAPKGATGIIGLLKDTDNYAAILYSVSGDIDYPVIQTYDQTGEKLNDIGLLTGNCCGNETNCIGYSWGVITRDVSIVLIDSEMAFKNDASGNSVKIGSRRTDSTAVYGITGKGYIRLKPVQTASAKTFPRFEKSAVTIVAKMKEPVKPVNTDPDVNNIIKHLSDSDKIAFKVQILSSSIPIPLSDARFKNVPYVEMYVDRTTYKYTAGHFNTWEQAVELQSKLRENRFKEAFLVAFKGKKRVQIPVQR